MAIWSEIRFLQDERCFDNEFGGDGSAFGWKQEFSFHFENLEGFKYEALNTSRSIRLISLSLYREYRWGTMSSWETDRTLDRMDDQSSTETISCHSSPVEFKFQPLKVSIIETSLDSMPEFETISYVWGAGCSRALICNGKIFNVSRNCVLALYHIAICLKPAATRFFWVDQICINQSNLDEKMQQVSIMPLIYESSWRTIGWIGEANENSRHLFEIYIQNREGFCGQRSHNPVKADALRAFIDEPYFRRGWIVPEATLSQTVLLLCGEFAISWPFLESLKAACRDIAREIHGGHKIMFGPLTHFSSLREKNGNRSEQAVDLIDTMKLVDIVNVTDERDRLYALYGLNKTLARLAGPRNYEITPMEVWCQFFQSTISTFGPDSCFLWQVINHYAGAVPRTTSPHWMPSWLPDLSLGPPERSRRCLMPRPLLYQCCQNSTSADSSHAKETELSKPSPSLDFSSWTLSCQASFIDVLAEDIFPNASNLQTGLRNDPEAQARIRAYEYLSPSDPVGILFSIVGDRSSRYPGLDTALPFGNAEQWCCMTIFTTTSGKLAITSRYARVGDQIVFFVGNSCSGQLSIVRRDEDNTCRYISTAFVSGWIKRKAAAMNIETIVLK